MSAQLRIFNSVRAAQSIQCLRARCPMYQRRSSPIDLLTPAPQGIDIDSRISEVRLLVHFAIESARLALQPMCTADIDALGRIANEPGVRRYLFDDRPVTRTSFARFSRRV